MYYSKHERIIEEAKYIAENNATIRETAKFFEMGKSTVYVHVTSNLYAFDRELALKVRNVIDKNKSERHMRGGMATKKKYSKKN